MCFGTLCLVLKVDFFFMLTVCHPDDLTYVVYRVLKVYCKLCQGSWENFPFSCIWFQPPGELLHAWSWAHYSIALFVLIWGTRCSVQSLCRTKDKIQCWARTELEPLLSRTLATESQNWRPLGHFVSQLNRRPFSRFFLDICQGSKLQFVDRQQQPVSKACKPKLVKGTVFKCNVSAGWLVRITYWQVTASV